MPHGVRRALRLGAHPGRHRSQRRHIGQGVEAQHADHFFDQVFFDLDVKAPARRRDHQHARRLSGGQAQPLHHAQALRLSHRHADHLGGTLDAQRHGLGLGQRSDLIINRTAGGFRRAADVDDELREAFDVLDGESRIHAALEAVAGIGRKVEPP